MKTTALLFSFVLALPLAAQDPPPAEPPVEDPEVGEPILDDEPPANLAAVEVARSRACVPSLARLDAVASELEPLWLRAGRIEALHRAVSLEDSARVAPFDEDDPLEREVREWFVADSELAEAYLETEDEALAERRREGRRAMLERLRDAYGEVDDEAGRIIAGAEGLEEAVRHCDGRIFVRSAVLEACGDAGGSLCEAAGVDDPGGRFRFVEEATDLWDIEQLRAWSDPSRIRPNPDGSIGGGRTWAMSARGNVRLEVSLEPLLQARDALSDEQVRDFDENLEALGFEFDHPAFVMAPALAFELDVPEPLGGETHYFLHFGDLSDPEQQLLWAVPAASRGPVRGFFAADESHLVRLAQGEAVSLTAVRLAEDEGSEPEAEAVYTLTVSPVGQARSVTGVLQYWAGGQLADDLAAFIPRPEPDTP